MTDERQWYAVDRVEGDRAILIGDHDGQPVEIPLASLPFRIRERQVLRVPVDASGRPDWARSELDEAEGRRRLAEASARLERLRRRDPGRDIRG